MTRRLFPDFKCLNSIFIKLILFITIIDKGGSTDIQESSPLIDDSLGINIYIPVLTCHVKYTGYHIVTWYKDGMVVKNSSADMSGHVLSVATLLKNPPSEAMDNVLKLQGYYWCETDLPLSYSLPNKYLFQIDSINTYSCFLIATQDSLGTNTDLSVEAKTLEKIKIYEVQLREALFGFLPKSSVYVTNITVTTKGLEVYFFLYVLKPINPRGGYSHRLVEDQHQLEFIEEYLHNQTLTDNNFFYEMLKWVEFKGIFVEDIVIRSTVGCYTVRTLDAGEPPKEITWPNAFIGDIAIPEESCSTKTGLAVTRTCTGSFDSGAFWGPVAGTCSKNPSELTTELQTLYHNLGQEGGPDPTEKLKQLTNDSELLSVTDLHIAATILKKLSAIPKLDQSNIDAIFTSINNLLEANASKLDAAKSTLRFTNRILESIETVMNFAVEENKEIQISTPLLLADSRDTQSGEKHLDGAAILSGSMSLQNGSVEFLTKESVFPFYTSTSGFVLPTDLIIKRESELDFPCQISVVFFKDNRLFTSGTNETWNETYEVIPTPVMQVSVSGGPAWNLTQPVQIYFKDEFQVQTQNPSCVYFDPRLRDGFGGWSVEGCSYEGIKNGYYKCHCHHLSTFSIILTQPQVRAPKFEMHISIYVGCGISIIALGFSVLLYLISKNWRSTVDQNVLFCLSLTLLGSIVIILFHEVHVFQWKPGCMLVTTIFYYLILSTFCWLFIQSVVYQLRFSKKTETSDIWCFMGQAIMFAWGVPVVVVGIIWITRKPISYGQDNCWATVIEVSSVASIPVLIVLILTMCVNANAAYSITCRYKKDFLFGSKRYNESALKFKVAISIYVLFVLSWIFGYLSLHYDPHELQILFSISLIVTSYYVSLFFIFHEVSFWEMIAKFRAKKEPPVPEIENTGSDNKSYNSIKE